MNFAPKSDEKQKQSLSDVMFSQPNLHEDQKKKQKKQGLHPSLCDEDQNKQILFDDFMVCGFIVQYMFYCAIVCFLWDI